MDLVAMKFDREVAKDIGTNSAIIFQNLEFWILKNKANNRNFYDGVYWTYMSINGFGELFDWLTERQIRTCLKKLVEKKYLTEGNYNKSTYDRTKWYTSNRLNGKFHLTEKSNRKDQSVKPIPYNNTDNNTNKKHTSIIRPKTKVFSQDIVNCLEACLRHFPDHLHPSTPKQKENALETIKRLNKIDKLPFEVVEEIVSKTRGDKFWCKNFLSINKLRKKNKEGIMYVVVFNEAIKSKPKPKTFKEIQQAHIEKIMSADVIKNHFR